MSDDIKTQTPEEVRAKVVEDYEIDETNEETKPFIDKVVNERIEHQKSLSTTIEQKAKYRQKLVEEGLIDPKTFEPVVKENLKTNEQSFTREEAILVAQGKTIEEVDLALKISKIKGVPISEAVKDDFFVHTVQTRLDKEMADKAALGASGGSPLKTDKPIEKMTKDEHKEFFEKAMG
jgi:hypothetical protein